MAASNSSDQMMNNRFMSSLQALMGPPMAHQQQRSASQKKQFTQQHQAAQKKDRLPSLHFGNLPEQFYDLDLFKFIKQSGHKVHKAFVVLDKKTNKNCDYGYAQFLTQAEATKCLAALNNATINGKVINVSQQMTSKPNPKANVFVRNLPAKVTQSELFKIYSQHGQVTKCKLECYADGTSRGFAYVQFEDEKDATAAIVATNNMEMQGKKLEVFAHEKKAAKTTSEGGPKTNNNVFV
jgi:RNA recognition motif-containing protein